MASKLPGVLPLAAAAVVFAWASSPNSSSLAGHVQPRPAAPARQIAAVPRPAPSPEPTNPFTLQPGPTQPLPLPVIGRTRSRAVCTALRQAVAPAVAAAMQTDRSYAELRRALYDYTVNGSEASRDLKIMQMDRNVQAMVKSTDALDKALGSHAFDAPANASSSDAQAMIGMRQTMRGVLEAQKVQLDAMSGFIETERMRRFGTLSEGESAMRTATGTDIRSNAGPTAGGGLATPSPSSAFLQDSNTVFKSTTGKITLDDARNLDRDLADIAAYTTRREDAATKIIVSAANLCH